MAVIAEAEARCFGRAAEPAGPADEPGGNAKGPAAGAAGPFGKSVASARDGLALLLDLGGLAAQLAEVVQLRAAHATAAHHGVVGYAVRNLDTGEQLRHGDLVINAGRREIREMPDGWTIKTKDRSLSAQWEHMILVTETGYEVLTTSAGTPPPPAIVRPKDAVAA